MDVFVSGRFVCEDVLSLWMFYLETFCPIERFVHVDVFFPRMFCFRTFCSGRFVSRRFSSKTFLTWGDTDGQENNFQRQPERDKWSGKRIFSDNQGGMWPGNNI
jgi:hypothetical protein